MRTTTIITIAVLLALAGGYLIAAHLSGGAFPLFGLPLGGERAELRRLSRSFLEDLQFKDFQRAARYHSPEKQATVDIPYVIQRLFLIKPEDLEIMDQEVVFAELDSSGNRGRVKVRIKAKQLSRGHLRTQEIIFYFERARPGALWYMKLEDSLRELHPIKGKRS